MSKFKVGDRVRFVAACDHELRSTAAKIGEIATIVDDGGPSDYPYGVQFRDGMREVMAGWQIRRLVKRKRANAATPDRVMVAAQLMAGMLANPGGPVQANASSGWSLCNTTSAEVAVIAVELADALIAEGSK